MTEYKKLKAILILFALITLITYSNIHAEKSTILSNVPDVKDHPDADAVIMSYETKITLNEDGTQSTHFYQVTKLFSDLAIDNMCDPKIKFDDSTQILNIIKARTYMRDGKIVDSAPKCFNPITPPEVAKAPEYTSNKQMVVTFLGVEKGAIIELEYELIDKISFRKYLSGFEYFREWLPIKNKEFSITIPENLNLNFTFLNKNIKPEITIENSTKTYKWTDKDISLINHENNQRYKKEYLPTLFYSTCPSWSEMNKILIEEINSSTAAKSEKLSAKIAEITKDSLTTWEKIIKIHNFVVDNISTIEYEFPTSFKLRKAPEIFDSSYGTLEDKTALLINMLDELTIKAYFSLVPTTYKLDISDNPNLTLIDKYICSFEFDGEKILLDPSSSLSSKGYKSNIGKKLVEIKNNGPEFYELPIYDFNENNNEIIAQIKFDKEFKGSGKVSIKLVKNCSPYFELKGKQNNFEKTAKRYINSILPGAKVSNCFVKRIDPDIFEILIEFKDFNLKKGSDGYFRFSIPNVPGSLSNSNYYIYRSVRMTPIYLSYPVKETTIFKITIPDKVNQIISPETINIDGKVASINISVKKEERNLEYNRELCFVHEEIFPEDYGIFKKVLVSSKNNRFNTWIFEKSEE